MPETRIGISGWTYPGWRGELYPDGLPHARELAWASRLLNSIEINGTFYALQRPGSFARWHDETPDDFVFAVKGGRYITHLKRLGDVDQALANFCASGVLRLGAKLGPVLWQLPPNLRFDTGRLDAFLARLPRDQDAAADLGRKHDDWLTGRAWTKVLAPGRLRHALEVRHASFATAELVDLLRRHGVALVVADTAGKWPYLEDVTADFVYCRLHGDQELYVSGYTDGALDRWAHRVRTWRQGKEPGDAVRVNPERAPVAAGRDVYVYFDNDAKVRAPFDAEGLARRVGVRWAPEDMRAARDDFDRALLRGERPDAVAQRLYRGTGWPAPVRKRA